MPKATPAASMLALFLLFGSLEAGSLNAFGAAKENPDRQSQSGTVQKIIVENGSVTMNLDLNRLNGIKSLAHSGYRAPVANGVPRPDHVVIVIEENHSYSEIIGSSAAPYINSLAAQGALFTQSYAITHPSQPNYLDLFSGSNQGVTDDSCPHYFTDSQPGLVLAQRLSHLRGLLRRPAVGRLTRMHVGRLCSQARSLGELHQHTHSHQPPLQLLPNRLYHASYSLIRDTQPRRRYARRHDPAG